jgi:hypothetical protein
MRATILSARERCSSRYLARDITVEVDTGTASREVFLVRQAIDVSLQCGIDVLRAAHVIPYRKERSYVDPCFTTHSTQG